MVLLSNNKTTIPYVAQKKNSGYTGCLHWQTCPANRVNRQHLQAIFRVNPVIGYL
jgi:hypothetical protein